MMPRAAARSVAYQMIDHRWPDAPTLDALINRKISLAIILSRELGYVIPLDVTATHTDLQSHAAIVRWLQRVASKDKPTT